MEQEFPAFDQIALGNGSYGDLYVFGLTRQPQSNRGTLYLAALQAVNTGAWLVPSYDVLGFAPRIESLVVGKGNHGNLQLIGLLNQRVYLAAWQDNKTGSWNSYDANPLDPDGFRWKSIALGKGYQDNLYVIGLTDDGKVYRGPWLNGSGSWDKSTELLGDTTHNWDAVAVGKGNDGNLQVLGVYNDQVYLVAWQDQCDGRWHHSGRVMVSYDKIDSIGAGNGNQNNLQVIALARGQQDREDRLHLSQWQSSNNGEWHGGGDVLRFASSVQSFAIGNGNNGNLQLVGIADKRIKLAAWQDATNGSWHGYDHNPLDAKGSEWIAIALGHGYQDDLYIVSLGIDRKIYLGAYQTCSNGKWHPGPATPLTNGSGRWNKLRLRDVPAAFSALPDRYSAEINYTLSSWDTWEPLPLTSHYQGMSRYHDYYVLPFSAPEPVTLGVESKIVVLDRSTRRELRRIELPEASRPHPGGCQIVGDFLAVELESYNEEEPSILRFYWLGSMGKDRDPWLLPAAITVPKALNGVTALAITDVGTPPNRYYVLALRSGRDGQELTCFKIAGHLLDDPELKLGDPIYIDTSFQVPDGKKHGPDNMNLLTDAKGNLYLVTMGGNSNAPLEANFEDWADLWRVDLERRKLDFVQSKHVCTSAGLRVATGVHLRFGAGTWVEDQSRMAMYASGPQGQLPAPGIKAILATNEFVAKPG